MPVNVSGATFKRSATCAEAGFVVKSMRHKAVDPSGAPSQTLLQCSIPPSAARWWRLQIRNS